MSDNRVDTSPTVADEVKTSTCYMCACRCGIKVHLKDGKIRYIQGNRDHPVNRGVLCAKGSAGIMTQYSPAKLTKPLKRVGERGSGEFEEIEWEEALTIASERLAKIRQTDPRKLAFFTGRDQSQALTGWWASQFGTPNYAAHGGFCSVNMAAAGLYSIGGAFWEFGEPDWDRTKYFIMFGVAEDHDSNPIKIGLGKIKRRGAKFVSLNPVRTGYSAIADEWLGIRPGTDGLFVMALIHELLRTGNVDENYLATYTNASWLVIQDPGAEDDGLFVRNEDGEGLVWDGDAKALISAMDITAKPVLATGEGVTLPDGRKAVPAFQLMATRYLDPKYAPDAVATKTGIPADTIKRIAAEIAHVAFKEAIEIDTPWTDAYGRKHEKFIGRPISMHAMRGISAHSNGFHTCRAIHLLQTILGSVDCPGGFRNKPPFPKAVPPALKPAGKPDQVKPNTAMPGPPLGFPTGPEDLILDENGQPNRIDKAFSWEFPLSSHGLMHMVIKNAWSGDPYKIDTLFMFMANMGWNSTMNTSGTMDMLTDKDPETGEYKIPYFIYSDSYFSETVAFADLVLPDTTYLERWDCISLLDRPICEADAAQDAIRQPIIDPGREVRPFQSVMLDLGARLGLPGMTNDDGSPKYPGGYSDYMVNHERAPGIGPLAGWRGENGDQHGVGAPNPNQLDRYIENGCFWSHHFDDDQKFYKFANKNYLEWAKSVGFIGNTEPIVLQVYSEVMQKFRNAARGHGEIQPPDRERARIEAYFDPMPIWYEPFEHAMVDLDEYPLHALTQRPMQMYHSWGSQNAWLRQITGSNKMYISETLAAEQGIEEGDWIWIESYHGKVRAQASLMDGVEDSTIWTWNAVGKRSGAWNLDKDAGEAKKGFLLNHVISELLPPREDGYRYSNSDPVTGQAAWYDLRVKIRKADEAEEPVTFPQFEATAKPAGLRTENPDKLDFGAEFRKGREQ